MTAQQDAPSPTDPGADRRRHVHRMWGAVAASWAEHAAYTETRHAENTRLMLALTAPRPGDRVLELACGAGGAGLAAAPLVQPGGEVVLSDVAPEMLAVAAARAAARGVAGVRTGLLDLEDVAEPTASFDVVLCRDGLQFAADPAAAAREIGRLLRPGGRVAVAVWGPRPRNPWLGLVLEAASAQLGRPVPPPGMPGPFSLSDPERLTGLLRGAGLADVEVREVALPLHAPSFEDWWRRTSALAGPLAAVLATMPPSARDAVRERLRGAVAPYRTSAGLELPGVGLLASARAAG